MGLRGLARGRRVPLNVLFQAAWAALLAARTERLDVVHGVLLAGRSSGPPGVESMIGPTLNVLPLRSTIDPAESVDAYLLRAMAALVEMTRSELVGLHEVLAWAGLPPGTPPSESYLVFQNVGTHNSERFGPGYFFSKLGFPLRVDVFPTEVMSLHISYDRTCFEDVAASRLLAAFRSVLWALVEHADGDVARVLASARTDRSGGEPIRIVHEGAARVADVRAASPT
jgi:non-ribosomal peptide synthetase component F